MFEIITEAVLAIPELISGWRDDRKTRKAKRKDGRKAASVVSADRQPHDPPKDDGDSPFIR